MKVLMLGNSFTYYHQLDKLISSLTGWQVERVTRGGAYLYQSLDKSDELNTRFHEALHKEAWDYVILQEQSNTPALHPELFYSSVQKLCSMIRQNGATPVMYATWAYREGSQKLASVSLTYDDMERALTNAYHKAASDNDALVADVGKAFTALRLWVDPYEEDDYHPSEAGSLIAAHVIVQTLEEHRRATW